MIRFILRRLVLAFAVFLIVVTVSFLLTRLSGDLAVSIAGPNATAEDVATVRARYGFDRPLPVQFAVWFGNLLHGDLGTSYLYREPVADLLAKRLPVTLTLGAVGLVLAVLVGVPLGIAAAVANGSVWDRLIGLVGLVGQAMPSFWLALLMMIWVGVYWQLLPISGLDDWQGYVMPGIVLAASSVPVLMRLTRAGMVEALASDYVRTARAKGLSWASVLLKHALRNAAMPVVTVAAVQFGFMLGGSVVIESIFALHGMGFLAWEAISKGDFAVVQAVVLLLATIFILLTLIADLLNALIDPRLRIA
ncbi:ABC transporter permease [uncultured Alsobacter sp.]|uniref:ABC transporter permease n=1 Tax=uncultured Alsobacter sp. TaxID=1748258 RepID=UPI0025FD4194|nr:ABC transporter permease [uncultured Alsobacter sp.]